MTLTVYEVTNETLLLNLITLLYCCSNPKDILSIWQRSTKVNNYKDYKAFKSLVGTQYFDLLHSDHSFFYRV